ncbi:unnamed protein product [Caretta caretta]
MLATPAALGSSCSSSMRVCGKVSVLDSKKILNLEIFLKQFKSYDRRLELLVLKEEFFPQLNSLKCSIQILTEAARELLGCEELHIVLRLVLRAGNYMNTGGYAGHAAGFRMASLLRLADTKATSQAWTCCTSWPWIQEQEVASELQGLGQRLAGARGSLLELGTEQLEPFRGRFRTAVQVP